jgi:quercetin dioxygenase-like cupin family protein
MTSTVAKITTCATLAVFGVCGAWLYGQTTAPGPTRTVLLQHDTTAPGYENVLVKVEVPVGGREGRHTHPGAALVHILAGVLTLDHEGRPTASYKAGQSVFIEAGKVHEGINAGSTPVTAIASFVIPKGQALATPAAK